MKPTFKTLGLLTLLSIVLLIPFIISDLYLEPLRTQSSQLYKVLHGNLYKQLTGFVALSFFGIEILLTLRKRGRQWKLKIPGSILFWRQLHIFLGVAFIGIIVLHTGGSMGHNFNFYFLLTFVAVALSAMLGVAAETRILSAPASPHRKQQSFFPTISKGPLIRNLRILWLGTHIVLVGAFSILLGFHIWLAYYFQ